MAEGTRLLSEYGDQYSIAGSNPALSVWEAPQIQGFGRFCMSSLADGPPPHSGMWKRLTRRHWRSIRLGFLPREPRYRRSRPTLLASHGHPGERSRLENLRTPQARPRPHL